MSKKFNNNGLPKKRVIVAAQQEVQKRVRTGINRGIRRGKLMGARELASSFNSLGFFARLKIAFRGMEAFRGE